MGNKYRERELKIQDKHEQVIEYRDKFRDMNEVLRLKKIEEKNEIDQQILSGQLHYGSPESRKNRNATNENSDHGISPNLSNHLSARGGSSTRGGSVLKM
jgi:hypothetical protein